MISSTAWHITLDGKNVPFVRSFKIIANVQRPYTTILVETHDVDSDGVPHFKNVTEREYWVRDIHHRETNPTIDLTEIPENYGELVP